MALNYSSWPVFPVHIPEDNFMSSMRFASGYFMDDIYNMNGEGFTRPWQLFPGEAEGPNFNYADTFSFEMAPSDDIVNRLPADPFDMDMQTTFTAITGWIEDLEAAYGRYARIGSYMGSQECDSLFSSWSMIYNSLSMFQLFPNAIPVDGNLTMESSTSSLPIDEAPSNGYVPISLPFDDKLQGAGTIGERYGNGSSSCSLESIEKSLRVSLGYLGVKELLSVEMVCKYLSSTIRGDPFLWKTIHIDQPLSEKIVDEVLVQLVGRAQGKLKCLSLVACPKISNEGLKRSLEMNPLLTKLSVTGCTRIGIECVLNIMRTYNSNKDGGGIKCLRIGGVYGVEQKHFKELTLLLGADGKTFEGNRKRHFFNGRDFYLPQDDDRPLDIEMCPRCENIKLVYDCPSKSCEAMDESFEACRACTICIPRCARCGTCINNTEYEETFWLELLCTTCFMKEPNYYNRRVNPLGSTHVPVSFNCTRG